MVLICLTETFRGRQFCFRLCVLPIALTGTVGAKSVLPSLQKKKDLTAVEGHVVLLEYLEEQPLLLARPGMWTHIAWLPCMYSME